jgi:hypothetical protein
MRVVLFLIALGLVLLMPHELFFGCGNAQVPDGLYLNKNTYDGAVCKITIHLWGVPLQPLHVPWEDCKRKIVGTSDYENCMSEPEDDWGPRR